jgi:hypothetical protein
LVEATQGEVLAIAVSAALVQATLKIAPKAGPK